MALRKQVNFLEPDVDQIRHQLRNIIESYNHDWDILAELAQNAVDAIKVAKRNRGRLGIEINAIQKYINITDNGCGISPEELPKLLAPFSTNKYGAGNLIGQKGVGITFVIFCSSRFRIETHHEEGSTRAIIEDASEWLKGTSQDLPSLEIEELPVSSGKKGTSIEIELPLDSENYFLGFTFDQLKMLLLTKSALGDTGKIWGGSTNNKVDISFIDVEEREYDDTLACSYMLPTSKLPNNASISVDEFIEWYRERDRSDKQKRRKLNNKIIYKEHFVDQGGRRIRYWACFVQKRDVWNRISVVSKLVPDTILEMNSAEVYEEYGDADYLFAGGMWTSTRGMPTGIRSEMKTKGYAGYLPNFFILLDDPRLSFDIGRKSIPGRQLGMLRDIAADVFRDMTREIGKYISGEPSLSGTEDEFDKTEIFNEIRDLHTLDSQNTSFIKRPDSQEATVAAIFFEMIGNETISGFQPLVAGYRNKYDLYTKYKNKDKVVEFKYHLSSVFRDFDEERKIFNEIDILVVWEVTERDFKNVSERGLSLEPIENGWDDEEDDNCFHFALTLEPAAPVRVISLEKLL